MSYPVYNLRRPAGMPNAKGLRRRPIAWMVSSLCMVAATQSARADNTNTAGDRFPLSDTDRADKVRFFLPVDPNALARQLTKAAQAAKAKRSSAQAAQAIEAQRLAEAIRMAQVTDTQRVPPAKAPASQSTPARVTDTQHTASFVAAKRTPPTHRDQAMPAPAVTASLRRSRSIVESGNSSLIDPDQVDKVRFFLPVDPEALALQLAEAAKAAKAKRSAQAAQATEAQRLAEAVRMAQVTDTQRVPPEKAPTVQPTPVRITFAPGDGAPPAVAVPTTRRPTNPQSTDAFTQWLEKQPDSFQEGHGPSEAQLRQIFSTAVQAAASRSPQVRLAYAEYQAANADVDEAKGQRWPQVNIGAQSRGVQFGPNARNDYHAGNGVLLNVTTTLFDWGRTRKTISSRAQLASAAQQKYEAELENSAYEVSNTLIELGKQRIVVELSQKFVDRMQKMVNMLREIVAVDRGRGSELTQAKTRLLQAQALRDAANAKVSEAELTLNKLVGDQTVPIPRLGEWQIQRANLMQLLAQLVGHPMLRQAQAEANAADFNAQAVRASALPQLNWVVNANTGRDMIGQRQPWQTMLTLNWNAFRGGSSSAAHAAAGQRAAASRQKIEQQRRDLEYAVRKADQDAQTLLERANLYRGLSTETDRVRQAFFEQWYHLGRRTLLDVLIAENDHYSNQVNEVASRFDSYQAVFREHAAAGALVSWLRGS